VLLPSFENNTVPLLPLVTEGHDEALNYGIARRQELSESTLRTGETRVKVIDEKAARMGLQNLDLKVSAVSHLFRLGFLESLQNAAGDATTG